jgi:pre-mRNA-processing factor 17
MHFLSGGYDKNVLYWDTEYGKVVKTFRIKKFPYCVKFCPHEE